MDTNSLANVLEWLADEVSSEVQLQTIRTFLFICSRPDCTQKDVEIHLNMTGASASRNIAYWTDRRADRTEGVGFIDKREDDYDRRMKKLFLTKKGRAFYEKLKEMK